MKIAKVARASNPGPQKPIVPGKLDEDGRDAESACARAMAEAEKVLRELSGRAQDSAIEPERSSTANEKPRDQSVVSRSGVPRTALPVDGLRLDPDLDFVFHDDGLIELTQAGCRRIVQAHFAGLDALIGIDGREVLRLLAPKPGYDPRAAAKRKAIQRSFDDAELTEAHARRSQPVAELLRAEESTEVAIHMIDKERERHEIESLAAVACGWDAEPSRQRSCRAGACRRPRTRPAVRARPRGARGDSPPQCEARCAVGARHGEAFRRN